MPMPSLRLVAALALVAGCADIDTDVTTSPTAHESPGLPPSLLRGIVGGRYLGGSALDVIDDLVVGDDGNMYVVGGTASLDFPITVGAALDASAPADCAACPFDGFVASLSPSGALRWARLIQTGGYDHLRSVAVDGDDVWVAGSAGAAGLAPSGFHGGVDGARGPQDGVLCRLDAGTGAVTACRYVGGNGPAGVSDVAVAPDGSEVVLATTVIAGEDLHLDPDHAAAFTGAHRATPAGDDAVVLGFAADLTLRWATYVGGGGAETGTPSVARDSLFTFVLTETTSDDAPTERGFDGARGGSSTDAYLAAFSDGGTALRYASYVGGTADEHVSHNSLHGGRTELYVGLGTSSPDMPMGVDTFMQTFHGDGGPDCGSGDVWIGRVEALLDGTSSLRSTVYLGGAQGERMGGFGWVESNGFLGDRIAVAIETHSEDMFIEEGPQRSFAGPRCGPGVPGGTDAFIGTLSFDLFTAASTYLGTGGTDRAVAIAQAHDRTVVAAGNTTASGIPFPILFDSTYNGGGDGFLVAYGDPFAPPFPGDGGGPFTDGNPASPDAGVPPGYDEGLGCCGASTPSTHAAGTLGLALFTLAGVRRRRRRS